MMRNEESEYQLGAPEPLRRHALWLYFEVDTE
jgi:hypothetical protein